MRNLTSQIGENAGKIWKIIAEQGEVSLESLETSANLSKKEVHAAVGWLARENKVKMEQGTVTLEETNLDHMIGSTAGKVYKILDIWEQADPLTMTRLADQSDEEIHSALGWLAREDKIQMNDDDKYTLKYDQT